mmetsp:Transcript_12432/g.34503  ORF Transcript_12432/g.34503 Transcript_12432/m.34503 type:complete len:133 (-) Transcript_12432:366-764(-)|eukprot:CAMPEP_0168741982 /NCGR_PEP_ID=MMETSP0724-20121128/12803_1 /TAXON_ID=265536 /ORGANISM="Amphiprora sp., Strain CCMP467" /LENGTH=132 /DNA_ID=CAMNT_0008789521 /DNA_START=111 /DNA_END=509 /DNA_ORIENTATION=+
MMKLPLMLISLWVSATSAFLAPQAQQRRPLPLQALLTVDDAPAVMIQQQQQDVQIVTSSSSSLLQGGIDSYSQQLNAQESSTLTVALKERKIPTKEEIAAKKRNFNLIFWGGGFVAPFLATIFYFGPKFWTK